MGSLDFRSRGGVRSLLAVAALLLLLGLQARGETPSDGSNVGKIESVVDRQEPQQQQPPPWVVAAGRVFGKWGMREGKECEEHYGIMPCSVSLGGNAALLVIYGYMLLKAAQLLSDGSELLLTVMNPGVIGGLVLPILGAFPDALLIADMVSVALPAIMGVGFGVVVLCFDLTF